MELSAKNEYAYDNDLLVSNERFLMSESEWTEDWKSEYGYNNGLLSSITNLDYDFGSEAYAPVHQYQYGYQTIENEPRLSTELYREWQEGAGWVSVDKFDYEYENGLISGGSEYTWNTIEWIEVERFTTISVNDTTYITYFEPDSLDSSKWVEYSREIYPNLTLSELYDFYTEFMLENEFITFMNLEFPDYIYQEKIEDVWENVEGQLTADYYDVWDGKLKMREIKHVYWNEEWLVAFNNEIWYNSKANADSATVYVFLGDGEKEAAGQEIYTYNNASQLAEVDFLYNSGNGLALQSTIVLNWELGTSNEPKSDISSFKLNPAYPNPFNPSTNITYSMGRTGEIKINVYDVLGRHVTTLINGVQSAGEHRVQFDAGSLSSGLYIVRMEAADYQKTQMITLVK